MCVHRKVSLERICPSVVEPSVQSVVVEHDSALNAKSEFCYSFLVD